MNDKKIEEPQVNIEDMSPEVLERYNIPVATPTKDYTKVRKYGILIFILILFSFAVLAIKNTWYLDDAKDIIGDISDAFTVPGIMFIGAALLVVCSNGGAFDMMVYGVKSALSTMFKKDIKDRKYQNFGDYRIAKAQNPAPYKHLLICGTVYFLIGVIFFVIYSCI